MLELVLQTPKLRVYRADSGQEAVRFAAMYNATYFWADNMWLIRLD